MSAPTTVSFDSALLRAPQVFDQYGIAGGVARDVAIWAAWNNSKQARLNVREFADLFGYSVPYLMKRVKPEQAAELKRLKFGPEFKDIIGYVLAKLSTESLVFPEAAPYVIFLEGEKGVRTTYKTLNIIQNLTTEVTRRGTSYRFELSKSFLENCRHGLRQEFDLGTYLLIRDPQGRAWSSGRKMYLHLCWKRRVWDTAKHKPGQCPSHAQYDELCAVAGYSHGDQRRQAHELRQLLEDMHPLNGVRMWPTVEQDAARVYRVRFKRNTETEGVKSE